MSHRVSWLRVTLTPTGAAAPAGSLVSGPEVAAACRRDSRLLCSRRRGPTTARRPGEGKLDTALGPGHELDPGRRRNDPGS